MRTENVHNNLDEIHGFLSRSIFAAMALKAAYVAIYRKLSLAKAANRVGALQIDGAMG